MYLWIPLEVGESAKLKCIPNFLKKKATFDDIFIVNSFIVYGLKNGKNNILYNLTNTKDNTHISCSSDCLDIREVKND